MANKRKKEVRKAPLTCYTTETYKEVVNRFVEVNHPGMTLSSFILQLVLKTVPAQEAQEMALHNA